MKGQLYRQHARQTQLLDLLPVARARRSQHWRGVGELVAGKAAAMGSPRLMVFGRVALCAAEALWAQAPELAESLWLRRILDAYGWGTRPA